MRYLLSFISIFILLTIISCGTDAPIDNTTKAEINPDTIIQLRINNQSQSFKVKKGSRFNFLDFQKFLDDYSTKPLVFIDTQKVDVTGDGRKERVIRTIRSTTSNCTIYAAIYDLQKLIYADTLELNEEFNFMGWDNDSVYFKLKPYSSFYEALFNKEILDSLDPKYPGYENWIEMYMTNNENQYISEGLDSLTIKEKKDSIKNALDHYKGKLVFTMHQMDRDILIWNKNKREFEGFYSP